MLSASFLRALRTLQNPFDFGAPDAHPLEPTLDLAQANQVLQASLSKLADEPDLEKFLGHLLTVCSDRFMATEAGIWRYENGLFRLFVSYEDGEVKHEETISHPGASLGVARKIQNQHVLARLRKREIISDYPEQFATEPVYEHFRDYFRRRGIQAALKIPLFLEDDLRGILVMRFRHRRVFKPEEAELAFALANQAVLALELTRLAEVAQTAAIMEERNRLARDIHDTLAQTFTSILMRLQAAALTLDEGGNGAGTRANIDRACDLAREGLANTRRSVQALRPPALMGRSLPMALSDALQQMTEGTPLASKFHLEGQPVALGDDTELELFRIAQEAITNSCKHAQARTLSVQLTYQSDRLRLMVSDDGVGFTLTESTALKGFGLVSMQQRAERVGGNLTICSDHHQGTQICVVLSLSRSQGDAA
jgi:signal transduction histidine kinase